MLKVFGLSALAASGLFLAAGQAQAAGCNGHVNVAEWGCAPWDNNNGPQFPHYVAPKHAAQPAKPPAPPQVTHTTPPPKLLQPQPAHPGNVNGGPAGIISSNSGGVIAAGGGNAVNHNGNGVIAAGGGNAVNHNGAGTVAAGGGNVVGPAGGSLISPGNRNGN